MDSWTIALLGDGGVGRKALAVQFTLNCFVETYDPLLEVGYRKQLTVDNKMCVVNVLETGGQEEYGRDPEERGFILVYSITSRSTFDRLEVFRQLMLQGRRKPIFTLVGNMCDEFTDREVSEEEGAALARSFGCTFLETSAKTGHNVEHLFTSMIRDLRSTRLSDAAPMTMPKPKSKKCCIF
ncbi:ras protein [Athelia psychrophila]|uniref:Ras protein n=1 Tax=Athelia psychrophila TaxID=1759441 RepID=A0A166HLK8_9AGAM|nr:ras protein [Fibularhizoctonia sp. CBS 109695]